ncbi:hypothetical protein B0T26DRAFT_675742 [Lasiosphaeria miniovina]|uniref:Protein kinase domain-containing protein n=1 Tax=Lasiosphaeria miniovina TaxID=1954250 RepID=A0AA40AKE1_9PEZI|nr:uncharacterized protein B0T26DRAFT_675742 [Lasiosphaeria miniovina]KAK0717434.1 hypothetical protein B0T26DRAFT_675742 [Lasiosphaeria miniovina]
MSLSDKSSSTVSSSSTPRNISSPYARDKISAEITISPLRYVLAKRQLPLDVPVTPLPQLLNFQYHGPGDATLLYKFYNGGTLYDVIMLQKRARRKVPEGFIWHVIAQLCRALCYSHTGHFPLPGRASLVILGDFGGAFEADHEASDMLCKPVSTEMLERSQSKYRRVDKEPRSSFHALSGYSDELIDVVAKFEPLIEILESHNKFGIGMGHTDQSDWPKFPSNEFLYGATIACADCHVARYRNHRAQGMESPGGTATSESSDEEEASDDLDRDIRDFDACPPGFAEIRKVET